MAERITPTDIPRRGPWARQGKIRTDYGDGSNYEVDLDDGFVNATHAGTQPLAQGDTVTVRYNSAAGGWDIDPISAAAGSDPCRFDTPSHLNVYNPIDLAVSPDGQWLAWFDTYDFGVTYYLEILDMTGAYISFQLLAGVPGSIQGGCAVFSPDGTHIAVNEYGAPYVEVFPFDTSTGTVSAAVAAPAVPPVSSTRGTAWAPDMSHVFFSQDDGVPIVGYAWSAGFGARVTDPAFPAWGFGETPVGLAGGIAMRAQGDFVMVATQSGHQDKRVFGWPWTGSAYGALVTADLDDSGTPYPWRPQFNDAGTMVAFTTDGDGFGGTYADGSADAWALPFDGSAFGTLVGNGPPDGIPDSNSPQGSYQAQGCWLPGTDRFLMPNGNSWNDGRQEAVAVLWEMTPPFSNPCYYRVSPLELYYASTNLMVITAIDGDHFAINGNFRSTSLGNPAAIYIVEHSGE